MRSFGFPKSEDGVSAVGKNLDITFADHRSLYDLDGDKFEIGPRDLAIFATCWMEVDEPSCDFADFDCDGVIGPGDLSFFATAWMNGNIILPPCQLNCPAGDTAASGTTDSPWANPEMIESFGLPVPPPDWPGWRANSHYDAMVWPKENRSDRSLRSATP